MSWRDLYTKARIRTGITPKVKDDYYKIMSDSITKDVNADTKLKGALKSYLSYAQTRYKTAKTFYKATRYAIMFVQWLSEDRKRTIKLTDMELPYITSIDAENLAKAFSEKDGVRESLKSYLITFVNYLISGIYPEISKDPFRTLEINMPRTSSTIVYSDEMIDEYYNSVMFGAPRYYTLFFRLQLETGQRPIGIYYLTRNDIENTKPVKDALDRTFYLILLRESNDRERRKLGESVSKQKAPADIVYVSEQLRNDIINWCDEKKITGKGYIFKKFFVRDSYTQFSKDRRENPDIASRLKYKIKYHPYGLRHTWASVIYAITGDPQDLKRLGGWKSTETPLDVYVAEMKPCQALLIAQNWGIYLPIRIQEDIIELKEKCERREAVPGVPAAAVSIEQFEDLKALVETLRNQLAVALKKPR